MDYFLLFCCYCYCNSYNIILFSQFKSTLVYIYISYIWPKDSYKKHFESTTPPSKSINISFTHEKNREKQLGMLLHTYYLEITLKTVLIVRHRVRLARNEPMQKFRNCKVFDWDAVRSEVGYFNWTRMMICVQVYLVPVAQLKTLTNSSARSKELRGSARIPMLR